MKKLLIIGIVSLLIISILGGCNSTKLADSFDKDTVEASAKQVIDYLNAGDYDSIHAMLREDGKEILTSEVLTDAVDKTYGKAGSFVEYKDTNVIGKKDKDADYAIALIEAEYEKKSVLFTISFDSNMELVGIFMR